MKLKVLAALAALSFAQPAAAAIITITATGTIASGFDQSGMFGDPNTDLTGALFSATFIFDTANGVYEEHPGSQALGGGIHLNGTIPSPGSGELTINGVTVPNSGNVYSLLGAFTGYPDYMADVINRSWADHVTVEDELIVQAVRPTGTGLFDSWHSDCEPATTCRGSFFFTNYYYDTVPGQPAYYLYQNIGYFDVSTIDVVVTGAVPEPATWAMMITGFGLVGGALRRRRMAAALG